MPISVRPGRPERDANRRRIMNGLEFTVLSLAIILASCLQGSIGFGMGMVAAPIVAADRPGAASGNAPRAGVRADSGGLNPRA